MAITKEIVVDKIEVSESSIISVRTATVLKEDGIELNRSFHRHSVVPSVRDGDTWKDADISGEDAFRTIISAGIVNPYDRNNSTNTSFSSLFSQLRASSS